MSEGLFEAFRARVQRGLRDKLEQASREFRAIEAHMSSRGLLNSGPRIRAILDETNSRLRDATDWTFSEVGRLPGTASIHREVHLPFVTDELLAFKQGLFDASKLDSWSGMPDSARKSVRAQRERIGEDLAADLQEFRAGVWAPRGGDAVAAASQNVVNVAGDFVGALQQGGSRNLQVAPVTVNWPEVRQTTQQLSEALSAQGIAAEVREALEPDLHTIQAQLRKPSPGAAIVRSAAQSLQGVAEGVLAGALVSAPHIAVLIHQLSQQIGLG